ncbi:MAG: right-handed parallel beta-helix repeat-containing protein, partial [Myxococcaceae bacterium]
MTRGPGALLLALLSLAGCGPRPGVSDAGPEVDAGPAVVCRELFAPGAGGECEPLLPEGDCSPGTMPVLGQRFCQPVGWTACGEGFEPEPSGWGCREVLPPAACTGATFEVLGQRTCQPLGDCLAAFPPAGAGYFVDPAGPLDATHFRTIGAALQAAPAGAVIAIESGLYAENVTATRPVKLVGRCPAQAKLVAPVNGYSGLTVAAKGVEVFGLGFSGHWYAVELMAGAEATVRGSLIEGSFDNGLVADKAGARLKLVGSVVRGTRPRQSAGGVGVLVVTGGFADIEGSALVDNSGVGLFVGEAGASATVSRTVVRDTRVDATGAFGYGVNVNHGATLTLTGSALLGNRRSGLNVQTAGTVATVSDTVIRHTRNDTRRYATGVTVVGGAKLTLTRCLVTDTNGPGVVALDPGTEVRVKDSELAGNVVDIDNDFGNGLYVFNQAKAFVEGSALVDNHGSAMQVVGEGTVASVYRSLLRGSLGIGPGL